MKQFRLLLIILTLLAVGSMNVYAEIKTWTLSYSDFNSKSYASNNGEHKKDGITYTSNQVMQQSSLMQFQKNAGYIYNNTPIPGKITKITLATATYFTIYVGTTESPSSGTLVENDKTISGENTYFYIKSGSKSAQTESITVTYETGGSTPTYTVTYDANGGAVSPASDSYTNTPINLPTPTIEGCYLFDGWYTAKTGGTQVQSPYTPTANTTLYAHWTAQSNKLSTPTNLKTTDITSNSAKLSWDAVLHASSYTISYMEEKNNTPNDIEDITSTTYTLDGLLPNTYYIWSVKAIGDGTTYCDSEGSQTTGDFTTAALPKYTITWSTPTDTSTTQVTPGDKVVLPATEPTSCSSTYTNFVGWFTEAAGSESNPSTAQPAIQVTAATVPTGNATYYAVFSDATGDGTTTVFSETFNKANGTGGNDNQWSGSSIASTDWNVTQCDNTSGWTVSNVNFANACIKVGSARKNGSVRTPSITISGNATITFLAGAWDGTDEETTLNISATNGKLSQTSVTMKKGEWTSYTITLSDVTSGTTRLTFAAADATKNRFFLDEIKVVVSSTTPATGYISSCCNDPAVVTVTPATTTINLGEDGKATTTVTCTQQNGGTGTWSYSVSPSTATFDGTNFVATAAGEYTLTATYTETCGKSGMATITVTNTPVLYFPTTPADPIVFGTVECGGNTPLTDKQTISLRGYNLTSDVTVTVTGDYKIAGTESAELADYATSLTLPKDAVSGSSASVYVISTPPMQSSSPTTGKVTFATAGGNTLEVNLSTPDITCTEYTLTLKDRGTTISEENYLAGASVPKPADPTGVCKEPINYIFDGWATAEVAEGSTAYTKVPFPYTMPAANTTLYAVYKYSTTISNDYQKITDQASLTDGEYLVVGYSSRTYEALSSIEGSTDGQYKAVAVTPTSDVITTDDETLIWNVSVANGKYTIAQGGQYLNINNSAMVLESTAIPYTLTVSSGVFTFTTTDSKSSSTTKISYYANNSVFNAFSKANTVYLYRRQQDTYYTTSPVCGPYVRITSGKELYVTAGNAGGTRSSVQVQDTVKFKAGNLQGNNGNRPKIKIPAADIICNGAATDKVKAVISQTVTDNGDGTYSISGIIVLTYKPVAFDVREDITLQLRAEYNTGNDVMLDAVTLHARSLPEKFVIVAKNTDWYALNADMSGSSSQPANSHVTVDETAATAVAPCNTLYTFDGMPQGGDPRYVRFVGVAGKYLWAASAENVGIQNYAGNTPAAANDSYNWLLTTSDNVTYTFSNPQNDRMLRLKDSKFAMYVSGVQEFRILPVTDTCVFNYAPANFRKETVKSTSATLAWDAVAGATMYQLSTDGTTWTDVAATSYTLTGLKAATPYTCYLRARHGDGTDICSEVTSLSFTTPDCDDVPYDLAYTADLSSVTITWKCNAASAKVVLYSDPECADDDIVVTQTANAKTCTFKGLPENIVRYAKVFAGGLCASEVLEVKTESPQMDVVEWDVDKINVSINTKEKVSVVLENEVTKQTTGQDALDIFFSKYFEAAGSVKLLAIYNGTKRTIDLSNVRIEGMAVTTTEQVWNADPYDIIDLSPIGSIAPDQEIVLYSLFTHHTVDYDNAKDADGKSTYDDKKRSIEIAKCIQDKQGWAQEGWYPVGDNTIRVLQDVGYADAVNKFGNSEIATGGDKVYRLIRTENNVNTDIDIIGAADTDADGNRTIVKTSDMSKPANGDKEGWTCNEGAEYEGDPNVSYQLSTNRHLLIRKKVDSGAKAVALNTDGFHTLCTEWEGRIVPKNGAAGETENDITCSEFDNVLGFNYNEYYTEYETFMEEKEFEESSRNSDGTITIDMPADNTLDKIPCQKLKIIVKNSNNEEIIANEYKVPIIVNQNTNTENTAFFGGKLTEEICKTCDVVVRDNVKLTHTTAGVREFRDMYVYAGSKLEIPEGTAMMLGSVYMFALNDNVSYAIVNNADGATTPAITIGNVVHIKRIDGRYWYPFSLPYDCNIADIVQLNGQPLGVYGTDWGIKYYNGYERQKDGNSTTHYGEVSKYWKMMPENGQLKAYTGYIIGLFVPAADEPLMKSVNFPPATESAYTENADSKTTPITNWSVNLSAKPRHHGWNFVGSPYISLFGSNNNTLGEGLYNTQVQMGWTDALGNQRGKDHIYVSIPNGGNTNTYTQALASGVTIYPFSAYFVQAIDPTNGKNNTLDLTYSKSQRRLPTSAPARTAKTDTLILTELDITNGALGDNTGVLVSNVYSAEYEIGDDLTKMYAAAQKPQLYTIDAHNDKMAYQALPDVLAHAIPLGIYVPQAGDYTLSLNRYVSRLEAAEAVYLLHNGAVVANLLLSDYTVSASAKGTISGYSLDIRRAPEVVTDIVPAAGDAPYIIARDGVLAIANLPADAIVQVYDVLGHQLLRADTPATATLQVPVPQTGVYTVVITTADGQQVLKTLLR